MGNPYYVGSTIRLRGLLKDFDGSPLTPDTKEIKVSDASGDVVATINDVDILLESEGIYYYDFVIPSGKVAGKWFHKWLVSKDDKPDIRVMEFEVVEV